MAPKSSASASLFLALNLLFFALVTASHNRSPPGSFMATCPRDALKLGVCANLLGLGTVIVGSPPTIPCCTLLQGLVDLEAAVCLCTAIRANVLGIIINVDLALSLLLNDCGRRVPKGFKCG